MNAVQDRAEPFAFTELFLVDRARHAEYLLREGVSPAETDAMSRCAEWTSTFPLQRVRKGRRIEAICPMVGPSIADRSMHISSVVLGEREPALEKLDEVLRRAADVFEEEIAASDPRLR